MKFVSVPRLLLKTLIERATMIPELHEIAQAVNRHCVDDERCKMLENLEIIAYKNVTDD